MGSGGEMNTGKSQASHLGHGIAVGHSMGGNWEGGWGRGGDRGEIESIGQLPGGFFGGFNWSSL